MSHCKIQVSQTNLWTCISHSILDIYNKVYQLHKYDWLRYDSHHEQKSDTLLVVGIFTHKRSHIIVVHIRNRIYLYE